MELHEYKPQDESIQTYYKNFIQLYTHIKQSKFTPAELELLFPSQSTFTYLEPLVEINPLVTNDSNLLLDFLDIFSHHLFMELGISFLTMVIKLYAAGIFSATATATAAAATATATATAAAATATAAAATATTAAATATATATAAAAAATVIAATAGGTAVNIIIMSFASVFIHHVAKLLIKLVSRIPIISHFIKGVTHLLDSCFPIPKQGDSIFYSIVYYAVQIIVQMVKLGTQLTVQIIPNIILGYSVPNLTGVDIVKGAIPFPYPNLNEMKSFNELWIFYINSINQILVTQQLYSFIFDTLHITKDSVRGKYLSKVIGRFSSLPYIYRISCAILNK
jgi:hypothetical protein